MPTLLDPPSDNEVLLLKVVAGAYDDADFKWPIWQYVLRKASEQGLDALDVLQGMPHWGNGYRFIKTDFRAGAGPEEGATVQLTAAGLWHSGDPLMLQLFRVLIVALEHAAWRQADMKPKPLEVVQESMNAAEFMTLLGSHQRIGGRRQPLFDELTLYQMLSAEPATWNCVAGNGGPDWVFHLNPVQLSRYINTGGGGGATYLTALEELIGTPPLPELLTPLHPLAVHDSFDALNLAWQLMTGSPLLSIRSMAGPGVLTQAVNSRDEFDRRCSALGILLESMTTAVPGNSATKTKGKKSLRGMQDELVTRLGTNSARATKAVDVLRDVVAVRNGQQHDDDHDAARARLSLGLAQTEGDWSASWNLVQHKLIDALRTVREELPI